MISLTLLLFKLFYRHTITIIYIVIIYYAHDSDFSPSFVETPSMVIVSAETRRFIIISRYGDGRFTEYKKRRGEKKKKKPTPTKSYLIGRIDRINRHIYVPLCDFVLYNIIILGRMWVRTCCLRDTVVKIWLRVRKRGRVDFVLSKHSLDFAQKPNFSFGNRNAKSVVNKKKKPLLDSVNIIRRGRLSYDGVKTRSVIKSF